nr:hypothetical protein [Geodermatophilus sabuli]
MPLTPVPLQTAGERALFAELARWDTGGAVRGAVVASVPMVDGPLERRISDAVLFVPEGLAVVRVVEVVRQSGVVTALPEGSWSIGPGAGPGDVLQLAGGGSSPLDGLMRAGMDAAVRLRRAGLEPGRIARLTVLVGDLTGLVPADGDLGEGDQVAILDPRSLLLGIARAARYTGVDNPRLWTTADVRAALEALGVAGRGPSVQQLNGEGFPYSPYVLRTPELLAPAAMTAAPRFGEAGVAPAAPPPAPVRPAPSGPLVDPVAAAAVAAAAIRADEEAAARAAASRDAAQATPVAVPARPERGVPPEPGSDGRARPGPGAAGTTLVGPTVGVVSEETGGIGGLFADAEPDTAEPDTAEPHTPAPLTPAASPSAAFESAPPGPVAPEGRDSQAAPGHRSPAAAPPPRAPAAQPTVAGGVPLVGPRQHRGSSRRTLLLLAAALVLVVVLGIGGALLLGDGGRDEAGASTSPASDTTVPEAPAAEPAPGDREVVDGRTFVLQEVRVDPSCAGNAYGAVADFFADTECAGLARALYSTDVEGRPAVVSVSVVDMGDAAGARALRALTDRNGSGNVSDLLREGVRYAGGPEQLSGAEYASAVSGSRVTIVEAAWSAAGDAGSTADLDAVAGVSLVLPVPEPVATTD